MGIYGLTYSLYHPRGDILIGAIFNVLFLRKKAKKVTMNAL